LIYLDTIVLAPFYWAEALSDVVEALLRQEAKLGVSQLVEVELCSALSRRVRMGEIERDAAQAIANRFQTDLSSGFYMQLVLEPIHYDMARDWIRRFDTPLRTLDALHLAIATSHSIPLVTADEGLAVSADVLGVEVRVLRLVEE
jgi:predicted nucleic acid-binding protein